MTRELLKQAARQALEALEDIIVQVKYYEQGTSLEAMECIIGQVKYYEQRTSVIVALRQALEQPKQEQEPVAWMDLHEELGQLRWMGNDAGWDCAINAVKKRLEELALYTETPKREWQNLTEAEIRDIRKRNQSHDAFAHAIVNKLKEKNT